MLPCVFIIYYLFSNVYSVRSQLFQWKQLENLYFREKKFAVEVNDPHRSEKEKHFSYLHWSY